jgi:hypothetical protein
VHSSRCAAFLKITARCCGIGILGNRQATAAWVEFAKSLVPVHISGERERRTGTKLIAGFLQHICVEVNVPKDVAGAPYLGAPVLLCPAARTHAGRRDKVCNITGLA